MEIQLFKTTVDTDLEMHWEVSYKNIDGVYCKISTITDIFQSDGFTYYLLSNAMGAYLAEELKLINR